MDRKAEAADRREARERHRAQRREVKAATVALIEACATRVPRKMLKSAPAFVLVTMRASMLELEARGLMFDPVDRARAELCLAALDGEAEEIDGLAYRLVQELQDRDDRNAE